MTYIGYIDRIDTKNQTDVAINAYTGLLYISTLMPKHTVCKSLMKLYRFKHVINIILYNSQKTQIKQKTFHNLNMAC